MNTVQTVTVTFTDGTTQVVFPTTPVVSPTDVEVDLVLSDGTVKKFVPQA